MERHGLKVYSIVLRFLAVHDVRSRCAGSLSAHAIQVAMGCPSECQYRFLCGAANAFVGGRVDVRCPHLVLARPQNFQRKQRDQKKKILVGRRGSAGIDPV